MPQVLNTRILLWLIAIIAVVSISQFPPVSQDLDYHHFADRETLFDIPNMYNVLSNIPFLLVGIYGLVFVWREKTRLEELFPAAVTFCIGAV